MTLSVYSPFLFSSCFQQQRTKLIFYKRYHFSKYYFNYIFYLNTHGKNDFAEGSKILLDLKIILLDHQNNFVGTLKVMNNAAKKFWYFSNWFKRST